ncbi:hypothetical protein C2S51_024864 [Perilla frutescens var. frutescens]|nr:hypothetical protein C2S51_024864 [Perilla frutescens var. frutescens]
MQVGSIFKSIFKLQVQVNSIFKSVFKLQVCKSAQSSSIFKFHLQGYANWLNLQTSPYLQAPSAIILKVHLQSSSKSIFKFQERKLFNLHFFKIIYGLQVSKSATSSSSKNESRPHMQASSNLQVLSPKLQICK